MGLDQVNIVLPAAVANLGLLNIVLTVNGQAANTVQVNTGPGADFYVASNGNDTWSGTLTAPNSALTDGPFATPPRAQTALESVIKTKPARSLTTMIRDGTYYLPGTLNFSAPISVRPICR